MDRKAQLRMKNEAALRYLILKHLKSCEAFVPASVFKEVALTLTVTVYNDAYVITWKRRNREISRHCPLSSFAFYQRGDIDPDRAVDESLLTSNDAKARDFALEALSLEEGDLVVSDSIVRNKYVYYNIFEGIALISSFVVAGGVGYASGSILLVAFLSEFLQNGRVYNSIMFLPLSIMLPGVGFFGAIVNTAFQFLDPIYELRKLRVALNIIAVCLALWFGAQTFMRCFNIWVIVATAGAFAIAGYRSLFFVHYRVMPLIAPFLATGFFLQGNWHAAVMGLAVSLCTSLGGSIFLKEVNIQRKYV